MATIITLNSSDVVKDSRAVINTNFSNLNSDKAETSSIPVKATGAEINTGTDDAKFATPKAITDSKIMKSPASSTDNAIVKFDGSTGKLVQDTGVTIDDNNNILGAKDVRSSNTIYIQSATPGVWLDETGASYKGAYVVLDDFIFQFQRRATNFGAYEAAPLRFDMRAPSGSFQVASTGNITANAINYGTDAQASDDYVITLDVAPTAYVTGMQIIFKANTINTGAATLNVNSLGAVTIVKRLNTALSNGDILAGMMCMVVYDGTNFVLMNPVVN
jgi:hypothetical protein